MWVQKTIQLAARERGFHLVTEEILLKLPEVRELRVGLLNLFIQHSSASLCINENADPSVRRDMERFFLKRVPDVGAGDMIYEHDYEGDDDMPAHIKSVLIGSTLSVPIAAGSLSLGVWQGIYLGEHRIHGGSRKIVATLYGDC